MGLGRTATVGYINAEGNWTPVTAENPLPTNVALPEGLLRGEVITQEDYDALGDDEQPEPYLYVIKG